MIPTVIALMIVSDREWMWLIFLLNKNSWMWVIVAHFFWEVIVSDLAHEKSELVHLCKNEGSGFCSLYRDSLNQSLGVCDL